MDVWSYVPPTIISAIVSAGVAWWTARRATRRSDWSARVDDVIKDIRTFTEDAVNYWSKSLPPADLMALSVVIKFRYHDITEQLSALRDREDIRAFGGADLERLHADVFDAATGGDFDSPARVVDTQRALQTAQKAIDLRNEIIRCRSKAL